MLYHFHIRDHGTLIRDEEGSELPDLAAAQAEARASSQDLMIEELKCGINSPDRSIEITDADGRLLESMAVRSILN
jgi:hypothetical protein